MKKFLKAILFIPIANFLSFFLFVAPMQIVCGFERKKYCKTFLRIALGIVIYVLLLNLFSFSNDVADGIFSIVMMYPLGIYICYHVIKHIE